MSSYKQYNDSLGGVVCVEMNDRQRKSNNIITCNVDESDSPFQVERLQHNLYETSSEAWNRSEIKTENRTSDLECTPMKPN